MTHNILYIEDNPLNITLIERFLKSYDCVLSSEYHATSGVRRATITQPDLIIADVHLPDENGVAMIRKLSKQEQTQHIPIIALTAMDSLSLEKQCLDAGAVEFLKKPINRTDFIETVSNYITLAAGVAKTV